MSKSEHITHNSSKYPVEGCMKTEILNQHIRIDGLNAVMSTMSERMNFLEKLVIEHKVKTVGSGPTVK